MEVGEAAVAAPTLASVLASLGLETQEDLRYAFTSADEAAQAGGIALREAWVQAHNVPAKPSAWKLWVTSKHLLSQTPPVRSVTPEASAPQLQMPANWQGARAAAASDAPAPDTARRRGAAEAAIALALSWGPSSGLGAEFAALLPSQREAWQGLQVQRLMRFEAGSISAATRTWQAWALWCSRAGMDALAASPSCLSREAHTSLRKPRAAETP